jgi:hypothetical protein
MRKVQFELGEDTYKNLHLLLHNLIELTDKVSKEENHSPEQYREMIKMINEPLRSIKTTLESK